jgi:hypothetical protein
MQRKRRRCSFSEEQLRQLKSTNESLRRLNDSALSQLQRIGNSYLSKKQFRDAADSFEILAIRMNSVLQFREELTTGGRAQAPEVAYVTFRTICPDCVEPLEEPPNEVSEFLKLDSTQLAEIDCALELAHHTGERVLARCCTCPGTLLKAFITGLSRLTRALLRQRRHLQDAAPEQAMRIEVREKRGGECRQCGKPLPGDGSKAINDGPRNESRYKN